MSDLLQRRGFLRALTTLPLIGGSVAILGNPTRAAQPITEALQDAYIAFLAHEHRRALAEKFTRIDYDGNVQVSTPMEWFPDRADIQRLVEAAPPTARAAVVLSAVGCDWEHRHV
jgi:hypothetical protein